MVSNAYAYTAETYNLNASQLVSCYLYYRSDSMPLIQNGESRTASLPHLEQDKANMANAHCPSLHSFGH